MLRSPQGPLILRKPNRTINLFTGFGPNPTAAEATLLGGAFYKPNEALDDKADELGVAVAEVYAPDDETLKVVADFASFRTKS